MKKLFKFNKGEAFILISLASSILIITSCNEADNNSNRVGISVSYSVQTDINLTDEGSSGWIFWSDSESEKGEKKSGKNLISDFTYIGLQSPGVISPKVMNFSWRDGLLDKSENTRKGGIGQTGERNGFRIIIPASSSNRTLKLFVGCSNATAMLYCKGFGFGFWSDTEKTWISNKSGDTVRCYTINFTAPDDSCELICEYKIQYAHGPDASISLYAAAITDYGTNAPPVVNIINPTEYQKIHEDSALTLECKAFDPDGSIEKVEYYMGGSTSKVGESTTPPYTVQIQNLGHKVYSITARAFDKSGQGSDSDPRRFEITTVDTFPPMEKPLEEYLITGPMKGKGHVGVQCLAELQNGDLICVFNAGNYENSEDQMIYTTWFKKGDENWTIPVPSFDKAGMKYANPVVYVDEKGKVFLFYTVIYGQAFEMGRIRMRTSLDNGKTWGPFSEIPQPDLPYETGTIAAIKPIRLTNGEIMLPLNRESYDPDPKKGWYSLFAFTADEGKTWTESEPIYSIPGNIQPSAQQMPDGSIVCYFRPRQRGHEIWKSVSTDNGRTWAPLENGGIPNPSTRSDFVLTQNGNFVIACNDSPEERSPFIMALSKDQGKTWCKKKILESGPSWYCYASLIQTRDGKLHVAYDYTRQKIKHMVIDEDWFDK